MAVSDNIKVFFQQHTLLPDAIVISADPDVILAGDDTSLITVQLYLNGNPYHLANVPISFSSTDDRIAFLPTVKTNLTDANGQTIILLRSNTTKGIVTVRAFSQITEVSNLTAHTDVEVVGWGTISGLVTDRNHNGVPNATVKLWRTSINESGTWSTTLYPSPENPQQTVSNPDVAAVGTYMYPRIPSGIYNVTAEKTDALGNNHIGFAIVNLTVGTATKNIAIPDLDISVPTHIQTGAANMNIVADGADSINVWAYVTDALNNPVADNTPITFTINPGTTYSAGMGKWSGSTTNNTNVSTVNGFANLTFGWVPGDSVGNNVTVTIAYANNPAIYATTRINFQAITVSWSGSVQILWGAKAGNVPVVLHVCGPSGELYTRNNKTVSQSQDAGSYTFDNIAVWPNVTYGYVSATWTDVDDVTYSGRSPDYILNKSHISADPFMINPPLPLLRNGGTAVTVREGDSTVMTVFRYGDSSVPVSVQFVYETGTAVPGNDFTAGSGMPYTLNFGAGETQKSFTIQTTPGSAGKYAILRQANASGAIVDFKPFLLSISSSGGPTQQCIYPNMSTNSSLCVTGGISGRVTTTGTNMGIADTDVWIVNASNTNQYFWKGKTNAQGYFSITNVNNTWVDATNGGTDPGSYMALYRAYCYDSVWGENYSDNLTVEVNSNAWAGIGINPKPAHVTITTSKKDMAADGEDNLIVSALVTDALNNPVNVSVPVILTIYPSYAYNATNMGRWGSAPVQWIIVNTTSGYANATFGWVSWKTPYEYVMINALTATDIAMSNYNNSFIFLHPTMPPVPSITEWTYHLKAGWNMISVPVAPDNDSVLAFFPADVRANLTDMWHYNNGNWIYYSGTRGYSPRYAHLTNVMPGKGYWVKFTSDVTFTIRGEALTSGVPTVGSGWTMIGVNGFSSLNASTGYPANKNMWYYDNGQWYYYSGTRGFSPRYPHLQSLEPGKGYWVNY